MSRATGQNGAAPQSVSDEKFSALPLLEKHRAQLETDSGISPEAIQARGYFSVPADANGAATLRELGFDAKQSKLGECLVIPLHNWRGETVSYAIRPTIPRNDSRTGKARKYELPTGATNTLDVSILTRADLDDPAKPILYTEGAKKADSAASRGLVAVSLNGVYGLSGKNLKGGIANLPELSEIPHKGKTPDGKEISRLALLVFDSDWEEKDSVYNGLSRLAGALSARGASVKMVTLPSGPHGEKTGLDDYFARGGTVAGLYELARDLVGISERERMKRESAKAEKARQISEAATAAGLPQIETCDRQLHEILSPMAGALESFNARAQCLFHGAEGMARVDRNKDGRAVISGMAPEILQTYAAEAAFWVATSETSGAKNVAPPKDLCAGFLQRSDLWRGVPPLEGITEVPFFAADGTLCDRRGYHKASRLWLDLPEGFETPDTKPTPANVTGAKRVLLEDVLSEVAFADEASRAHALALILQPFIRSMIGGATPIFLFDAPTQSSGKSYAAELCIMPYCLTPDAMNDIQHPEEWEKSIFTAFLEGRSHLFFDNISSRLSSPALASYVTQESKTQRVLGKNKNVSVRTWGATWVATSNNAILSGDAVSRVLPIRLDTRMETPESREFKGNPKAFIRENRAQVIGACLCLVRAWIEAGKPLFKEKKHRFVEWSEILGGILQTLEIPGFLENLQQYRETLSEEKDLWREFVGAWADEYGTAKVTAFDLLKIAQNCEGMAAEIGDDSQTKKRFGMLLSQKRDQIFDGWKIEKSKNRSKAGFFWRLLAPENPPKTGKKPEKPDCEENPSNQKSSDGNHKNADFGPENPDFGQKSPDFGQKDSKKGVTGVTGVTSGYCRARAGEIPFQKNKWNGKTYFQPEECAEVTPVTPVTPFHSADFGEVDREELPDPFAFGDELPNLYGSD